MSSPSLAECGGTTASGSWEIIERCAACGTEDGNLRKCTGCYLVYYCGKECQLIHRKAHRRMCREQENKLKNSYVEVGAEGGKSASNRSSKNKPRTTTEPIGNGRSENSMAKSDDWEKVGDPLDKTVVEFFAERFTDTLMVPLLGSPNPAMWDMLFQKKGARDRVHAHMLSYTIEYLRNHSKQYASPKVVQHLLEADYHRDVKKEPIFEAMQKELHRYLKEAEQFL